MKYKLTDICDYVKGKISVSMLTEKNYISTENMLPDRGGVVLASSLPTTETTQIYLAGDVLISNIRPYFKKIWYARDNGGCSNDVLVLRAKPQLESKYLYYALSDDKFFDYTMATSHGAKMPRGDKKAIMQYEINIPSLENQRRIVSLLSVLEDKIEVNKAINNNLEQQVATIFEQLYSTGRTSSIGELATTIESGSRPKGGAENDGIPSIGAEKIEGFGKYDYSGEKYISEEFYLNMKRGKILSGDVLLYKDGAYTGKSSMALDGFPHKKCAVNEHVFILRSKDMYAQAYLYFCLQKKEIRDTIFTLASKKSAQPGLNRNELTGVSIKLPTKDAILSFESTVAPFMHQIAANALESKRLSELRDVLIPRLMSGELDVSDIDL